MTNYYRKYLFISIFWSFIVCIFCYKRCSFQVNTWILFFYLGEETNSTTMSKNNTNTGKTTTQSDMKDGLSIQVCVGQLVNKWMCSKNHWNWYKHFWGLFWQCCLMLSHIRWQADSFLLSSWLSCFVVQLRMQKQDNFIINTKLRMWFG